ncbi:thermonuclease family protein [Dolichospermum circinale]|uniref:thermonuclease family protein n=1 Tax=Dolichospermum circinale TaxID=109265 RepID=UPI000417E70A|nr:thermonuclease family protein [Dolichospermum circinale]
MKAIKVNVLKIHDGDSLTVNYQDKIIKARMRFIDAPELKKPWENSDDARILDHWRWGINAKLFLTSLIPKDNFLYCYKYQEDDYERSLCDLYISDVISQENNVQLLMCAAGMSAYFLPFQYYDFTSNRELDLFLEIIRQCAIAKRSVGIAKNRGVGFWRDNIILPYQIKGQRF